MGLLRQHQNSGNIPYYTGLQIQTSGNNVPITIVWGANKIAPNCIWTGGFYGYYGYPEGSHGGGKGGGGNPSSQAKSWQYYTSWEMGLCEGPIYGLGSLWLGQNATNLYGADIWAVYNGTQDQTPWPILSAYYPGQTLSYHGLAYITSYNFYLGSSANLPQYSMEVFGVLFNSSGINGGDADPAQIIQDFLINPQYGAGFPPASIDATTLFSNSYSSVVTISIGSPAVVNWALSALSNGTPVVFFTTGTLPTGLTPGVVYYIVNSIAGSFGVAATPGGLPVGTSGSQSGTHMAYTADSSYQGYCRASYLALSPALTNQEPANTILSRWLKLTNTAAVWSGGKLKFIPYGDTVVGPTANQFFSNGVVFTPNVTPVYALGDDDFIHQHGKDPVEVTRIDPYTGYNWQRLQIQYRISTWLPISTPKPWAYWQVENSYVPSPIDVWDQNAIETYGLRVAPDIIASEICDPQVGQVAAQLILQRGLYIRNHYKFTLSFEYCLLEPMDLVNITDLSIGLDNTTVRVIEIEEDDYGLLAITAEEFPGQTATAVQYPVQTGGAGTSINRNMVPARVNTPVIFEPPASYTGGIATVFIAASGGIPPAYFLAEDSSSGYHYTSQIYNSSIAIPPIAAANLTFSIYVQPTATRTSVRLTISNGTATAGADFNLDPAAPYATSDSGVTASVNKVSPTSQWYLLAIQTAAPNYSSGPIAISPTVSVFIESAFQTANYPGTIGDGVYIWGQQFSWSISDGSANQSTSFLPPFQAGAGATVASQPGAQTPEGVQGIADPNWGGANVWLSTDNSHYSLAGQILGPSRQGILTADLGNSGGIPNTTDICSVSLIESGGTLLSGSTIDAQNGVTLCFINDSSPEFFSYETAALTGTNAYNLTTLYRGLFGTSPAAHSRGTQFVRVDNSVFQYALPAGFIGATLYAKFQSFNIFGLAVEDLSECAVYTYTPTGAGAPLGPVSQTLAAGISMDLGKVSQPASESDQWGTVSSYNIGTIDLGTVH